MDEEKLTNCKPDTLGENRITYIDLAKGVAIIAVIIGHMHIWKFNNIIYSFHMPFFFILSGAFISQKYSEIFYIKRKAWQLLRPYIFTCVMLILLSVIINIIMGNINDILHDVWKWLAASFYGSGNIERYGIKRVGAIWFLLASFFSCSFVRLICNKKYAFLIVILVGLIGYLTTDLVWLPLSLQVAAVASIYVYIGYYLKNSKKKFSLRTKFLGSILVIIIWILTICFGQINMAKNLYKYGIFSFLGALCGVLVVFAICKKFAENKKLAKLTNLLCFYGKNSLVILCFHLLELEMFPWKWLRNSLLEIGLSNWTIIIVRFGLKMCIATLAIIIVNKFCFLKNIFYSNYNGHNISCSKNSANENLTSK